jgi:hypothetical protein
LRDILYDFDSRMQEKPTTYKSLLLQYIQMKKKSLRGQTIKLTRCIEFYRPFCYFRTMIVDEWKSYGVVLWDGYRAPFQPKNVNDSHFTQRNIL